MNLRLVACLVCCLPHTAGGGRLFQRFLETPTSAEVPEGADVVLRCRVEHQQGQAQWTKDGFALGFKRDVPGYPRYMYLGDPEAGEHHLLITRATITDDGEYQCQVGPTLTNPPIWAIANLTVLVPPARIRMEGGSQGSVVQVMAGKSFTLQCLVADARPPPTIRWYLGHHQVDPGQVESQVVSTSSPQRWSLHSQLTLRARAEDNGKMITCHGEHPALMPPAALTASRTLIVLHHPSTPVISGYLPGEALHVGELRTLTCHVSGGNPRPSLLWYHSGHLLDDTFSSDAVGTVNTHDLLVTSLQDGSRYECHAQSKFLEQPLVVNVTLTVHYPPSEVSVRGPSRAEVGTSVSLRCDTSKANPPASLSWLVQGEEVSSPTVVVSRVRSGGWVSWSRLLHRVEESQLKESKHQLQVVCRAHHQILTRPIYKTLLITVIKPAGSPVLEGDLERKVTAGTSLDLACSTTGGHPLPSIRIYKQGLLIPTELTEDQGVTRARGRVKVMPADNGSEVKCEVTSPTTGSPKVTSATLSVLFAPRKVSVWASPSAEVEVGQLVTLSCSASSSNPKANITWRSGDAMLQGGITYSVPAEFGGIGTRSEFRLKAVAEDNGKAFMCEAENGLGTTIHKKITLSILQPPSLTDDPATTHASWVDLGKSGHLVCHARAAPPPNFTWTTEDTHNIETSEKYIIHKPELLDGLMLWASVLEVVNVTRQDYGEYQCSATNDLGTDSTWLTLKPPTRPHPPTNLTYEDTNDSSTGVSVTGLSPGRKYISSVQGRNDHGNSDYVSPKIPVTTLGTAAEADRSGNQHLTSPLLLVVVVSTTALFVLNVVLILCYLWQYKRRNKTVKSASSTKITSLATQRNTPASSQDDQHHHILMSLITDSTKIPKGYQDGHHDTKALDQNINSVCSTSPTRKKHRISQKSSAIKWNGTTRCKGKMPNNAKIYTQNNHTKIDSAFLHNQLVGNGRMSIHNKLKTNTKETTSLIPKCKVSGLPQIQLRNSGLDDDQISESSNESTDTAIFCDVKTSSPSESGKQQQRHSHIPNEHDALSYVHLIGNELHQQAAAQQQLKQDKFVKFLPECTTEMLLHNNIAQPYSLDNHQQPNYHQACNSRGSDPVSNYDSSNHTIKATVELTTVQRQQDKPALGHNPTTTTTFSPQHQPPSTSSKAQLSHLTPEMSSKTQQQQLLPPSTFRVKKCLQQPAAPTNTQHCHLQPDLSTRAQKHKLSNNSAMRVQLCHLPPSPTQAEHRNQPPNSASRLQNHSLPPSSLTKAQYISIPPNLPTKSQNCHQPPYLSIRTKNTLPPAPQKKTSLLFITKFTNQNKKKTICHLNHQ